MRRDVDRIYQALDLFVLPSHREGFPRAAMEAAASGLPVIATDIRGCRQVVEDGVNGYLFPVGEVEALTAAITRVGEDENLRKRMARESVSRAAARFDERLVVDKVMGAYADVAAARGLHPALVSRWGGKVS
jgi:glycosyltransferase involved in cell wall biosynthesis